MRLFVVRQQTSYNPPPPGGRELVEGEIHHHLNPLPLRERNLIRTIERLTRSRRANSTPRRDSLPANRFYSGTQRLNRPEAIGTGLFRSHAHKLAVAA